VRPASSANDRLVEVRVDAELGREAFTYRLASGAEGSVHAESVLDGNASLACLYGMTRMRARRSGSRLGDGPRASALHGVW
jgi:hypothetical protein